MNKACTEAGCIDVTESPVSLAELSSEWWNIRQQQLWSRISADWRGSRLLRVLDRNWDLLRGRQSDMMWHLTICLSGLLATHASVTCYRTSDRCGCRVYSVSWLVAACNAKPLGLVASGADPGYTNHQKPYCTAKLLKEGWIFLFTKTLWTPLAIITNKKIWVFKAAFASKFFSYKTY